MRLTGNCFKKHQQPVYFENIFQCMSNVFFPRIWQCHDWLPLAIIVSNVQCSVWYITFYGWLWNGNWFRVKVNLALTKYGFSRFSKKLITDNILIPTISKKQTDYILWFSRKVTLKMVVLYYYYNIVLKQDFIDKVI